MNFRTDADLVSIHGGHSGQFCSHAQDSLEAVVKEYIRKGFTWVGITEHMPPTDDRFVYPDESIAGLDAEAIEQRFGEYIKTCRAVQKKYATHIRIFLGFETDGYPGALDYVEKLRLRYDPDYIVGSVHHIGVISIDMGVNEYAQALRHAGGYEVLYSKYFDRQYELLRRLKPEVVGHFDLIRIFDPHYNDHLLLPEVWQRICRNLEFIRKHDLILDYNLRALSKGAIEPYVAAPILKQAIDLGIAIVPGDDSHGVASAGNYIEQGIAKLISAGADANWITPVRD